jgi:hypothetical protein
MATILNFEVKITNLTQLESQHQKLEAYEGKQAS